MYVVRLRCVNFYLAATVAVQALIFVDGNFHDCRMNHKDNEN